MRWWHLTGIVVLWWSPIATAQLQFGGLGPTVWLPTAEIATGVRIGYGGSIVLGSRQYCQLWGLAGLHYYRLQNRDTAEIPQRPLPPQYRDITALEIAARVFPWHPTRVPVYAQLGLIASAINAQDAAFPGGLGTGIGLGLLFPFSDPCCSWFLEAAGHYVLWNVLLRSDIRPIVRSWLVGLHVRVGL